MAEETTSDAEKEMLPTEKTKGSNWVHRVSTWFMAHPRVVRWTLAGPIALVVTFFIMGGMAVWWPSGAAGIDQIAMPIVLFPLIWVCVLLYAVLDDRLVRATTVMAGIIVANGILITTG